jgi:hypothetical protein
MFGGGGVCHGGGFGGSGGDPPHPSAQQIARILAIASQKGTVDVDLIQKEYAGEQHKAAATNGGGGGNKWGSGDSWSSWGSGGGASWRQFPDAWGHVPTDVHAPSPADAWGSSPPGIDAAATPVVSGSTAPDSSGSPPKGHTSSRTNRFYNTSDWVWTIDSWQPHHSRLVGKEHWDLGIFFLKVELLNESSFSFGNNQV